MSIPLRRPSTLSRPARPSHKWRPPAQPFKLFSPKIGDISQQFSERPCAVTMVEEGRAACGIQPVGVEAASPGAGGKGVESDIRGRKLD